MSYGWFFFCLGEKRGYQTEMFIQRYVIKFVSDLRQVGGFLRVLWKVGLNTKTQTIYDYILHRCKKNRRL
jgi:hypothetical protein